MLQWLYSATLGRLVDIQIRNHLLFKKVILGPPDRVSVHKSALVNNALFNVLSGKITVMEHAFFGQNVCLLTGAHDIDAPKETRKLDFPTEGGDIIIEAGVWVASNATILGPCVVGEMAVVAAGAVVRNDVPAYSIVGGVPAEIIGKVPVPSTSD